MINIGDKYENFKIGGILSKELFYYMYVAPKSQTDQLIMINGLKLIHGENCLNGRWIFLYFDEPVKNVSKKDLSIQYMELNEEEIDNLYNSVPSYKIMYLSEAKFIEQNNKQLESNLEN